MTFDLAVEYLSGLDRSQQANADHTLVLACNPATLIGGPSTAGSVDRLFEGSIDLLAAAARLTADDRVDLQAHSEIIRSSSLMTLRGLGYCACSPVDTPIYEAHSAGYEALADKTLQAAFDPPDVTATDRFRQLGLDEFRGCADPGALALLLIRSGMHTIAGRFDVPFEVVAAMLGVAIQSARS